MADSIHNILFLHPMKTGGSSIAALLGEHGYDCSNRHERIGVIAEQLGHEAFSNKFKVLFCRNPYDRLVSFYFFCARAKQSHAHASCSSVNSFANWVVKEEEKVREWCWPQSDYVFYRDVKVIDRMGRFERFNDEVVDLFAMLGIENVRVPHKQRTDAHRQNYTNYYSPDVQEIVGRAFKDDFEIFNYDIDNL